MHFGQPCVPGSLPLFARHILSDVLWVEARGGSMRPFMRSGRPVPVRKNPGAYKMGDVVLYGPPEASALHRLFFRSQDGWWIGDDAGRLPFHWVPESQFRGRVDRTLPQGAMGWALGLTFRLSYKNGRLIKKAINYILNK